MTDEPRRSHRCRVSGIAPVACLTPVLLFRCLAASVVEGSAPLDSCPRPLDLIAVPEQESWLLLAAAPVAGKPKEKGHRPIILALSTEQTERELLNQLLPSCNSCSIISMERTVEPPGHEKAPRKERIRGSTLMETTLLRATMYWPRAEAVVICQTRDPELAILGATLAAHMSVPFTACESETEGPLGL